MTAKSILIRTRKSWISRDFAKAYPDLIVQQHDQNKMNLRCTLIETKLPTILKILYPLQSGAKTFSQLYTQSQVRAKKSFCDVLRFCIKKELINHNPDYTLTMKGYQVLLIFK